MNKKKKREDSSRRLLPLFKIELRYEISTNSTFCLMDAEKNCVAVTVYNLAKGRGVTVGDTVVIPEPYLTHQSFSFKENVSLFLNFFFLCSLFLGRFLFPRIVSLIFTEF